MRKFGVFTATLFIAIIVAGTYGTIHDQVTYSISPEYFTKFKYRQFGFEPAWFGGHRQTVAVIGFLASWWMGLFIGILLGLTGLIFSDHTMMQKFIANGIKIILITSIVFAIIGFFWGKYHLINSGVDWWLPDDLINKNDFIIVGSIHTFSYLGGIVGILLAIIYMIRTWFHIKNKHPAI